jgi:two-component system nitrogen regulation response regulator GlnG
VLEHFDSVDGRLTESDWFDPWLVPVGSDDTPTFDPGDVEPEIERACVPALTLVAHPEVQRLGQAARLHPLRVRRSVRLGRTSLSFAFAHETGAPLLDSSVSRREIVLSAGAEDGSTVLDPGGATVHADGAAVREPVCFSRQQVARGVQLRLSSRVGLLLHFLPEQPESGADLGLLGASGEMSALRRTIERAAPSNASVLILGETGCGKELVARAIHRASARAARPMIAVNMATLTDGTAASQLFGHLKGAFTGAGARHLGLFETAHGGTLFLDEVGDATPGVQAMLLRILESSRVLPLGSSEERAVDVRVLAATELDVLADTQRTSFRSSLAQRLSGVLIQVPPLRARRSDIPGLLLHFLSVVDASRADYWLSGSMRDKEPRLSSDVMFALLAHEFPGNVRELRNIAQHILSFGRLPDRFASGACPSADSLSASAAPGADGGGIKNVPSVQQLRRALAESDWSPSRAARTLGVANSTLHYWMREHRIARRATEIPEHEIRALAEQLGGDVGAMSRALSVSVRGLRLRLRRIENEQRRR